MACHSLPPRLPLYLASLAAALAGGLVDWRGVLILAVFAASAGTLSNLLFICGAKEAFFRGLFQARLSVLVARWP